MSNKKIIPAIRFKRFVEEWDSTSFDKTFSMLSNNTLSRADLNYDNGSTKNVHYGDVLIRFGECTDTSKESIPYISDESIASKFATSHLQDGDIVFADTAEDATAGKCTELFNIHNQSIVSGLHTIACHPLFVFSAGYLGYYLNSSAYHNQLLPLMQGTKVVGISKTAIKDTKISFPSDTEEQEAIGRYFQNIDKLIGASEQRVAKLKTIKKACLEKMFPRHGSTTPALRFKGFTDEWKKFNIENTFKITRGYVLAATVTKPQKSDKYIYPVFSSQTKENGLMGYYFDYLYSDAITWTTDGANAGTVNFRAGKFYCTNVCGVLLSDEGFANKMVAEVLNMIAWKYVSKVGNPKLMNNVMGEINIVLPNDVDEQQKIANYLTTIDNLISKTEQKIEKLKNIKKACLDKMFVNL